MFLLSLSCLVILLYILIFVHLVVFVLCISFLLKDINLLLSLLSVFLGYVIPHKGYVCYDPHASRIRVSRNVIFFENQYFFPSHVQLSSASVSLLPIFSESPTIVEQFKPGFVYERRG